MKLLLCFAFVLLGFTSLALGRSFTPNCGNGVTYCPAGTNPTLIIPQINEDDIFEVAILNAPVFEERFGKLLGQFHLFHTGVGFRNLNNGLNYSVEFDAVFDVFESTFPVVTLDENKNETLLWCNDGAFCFFDFLNESYWESVDVAVGTITGTIFKQFLHYVASKNETDMRYQAFNLLSHWGGVDSPMFFVSQTCFDHAWDLFSVLEILGAKFRPNIRVGRDYLNMFTDHFTLVDFNDSVERHNILGFFKDLRALFTLPKQEFFKEFEKLLQFPMYYYIDDQYYKVKLVPPFFDYEYAPCPIPRH
eukprot:GCRY01000468.1.p1 GENE.GCRY01000468.1~~GCRY01000468.1.p1  ORF type:complete len:305 (+),score=49.22 GCRY01000468.1:158-1072(+)